MISLHGLTELIKQWLWVFITISKRYDLFDSIVIYGVFSDETILCKRRIRTTTYIPDMVNDVRYTVNELFIIHEKRYTEQRSLERVIIKFNSSEKTLRDLRLVNGDKHPYENIKLD